jgi:hypothetical protein
MENILYSRHLRRVENSKIIETFDDYDDENDGRRLPERRSSIGRTTIEAKLPEIARRSSGIRKGRKLFNCSSLF